MTRAEFLALAQRYRDATDPAEASRLEDEVVRGFYGPGAMKSKAGIAEPPRHVLGWRKQTSGVSQ